MGITRRQSETLEFNNFWTAGQEFSLKRKKNFISSCFISFFNTRGIRMIVFLTYKLCTHRLGFGVFAWIRFLSLGPGPVSALISRIQILIQILGKKECRMCSKSRKLKKEPSKMEKATNSYYHNNHHKIYGKFSEQRFWAGKLEIPPPDIRRISGKFRISGFLIFRLKFSFLGGFKNICEVTFCERI